MPSTSWRLVLGQQALEPEQQRQLPPPVDRRQLEACVQLGQRRVERPAARCRERARRRVLALGEERFAGELRRPLDVVGRRKGRDHRATGVVSANEGCEIRVRRPRQVPCTARADRRSSGSGGELRPARAPRIGRPAVPPIEADCIAPRLYATLSPMRRLVLLLAAIALVVVAGHRSDPGGRRDRDRAAARRFDLASAKRQLAAPRAARRAARAVQHDPRRRRDAFDGRIAGLRGHPS